MNDLFGSDGIRGVIDRYPFRAEDLDQFGRALAAWWLEQEAQPQVLIGTDTRESNQRIKVNLVKGLTGVGVKVYDAGVIPTAAVSYLVAKKNAFTGGLMISASHNPIIENGIKVFDALGTKIRDQDEDWIETVFKRKVQTSLLNRRSPAPVYFVPEFVQEYAADLAAEFRRVHWSVAKVALDCAHGAAYQVALRVLDTLKLPYIRVNGTPTGSNINRCAGSEYARLSPLQYAKELVKYGADIGIALDGDADRVALLDQAGHFFDGDRLLVILAGKLKRDGKLAKDRVVITQMSNSGLGHYLRSLNIDTHPVKNGDKYITAALIEHGLVLGGEQIGHIILHNSSRNVTGDGLRTALWVLAELSAHPGVSLAELAGERWKWPQVNATACLRMRTSLRSEDIPGLDNLLAHMCSQILDLTRIECRPASTEPVYRVMLEAKSTPVEILAGWAYALSRHVQAFLKIPDMPVNILDCDRGGLIDLSALEPIPGAAARTLPPRAF